MSEIRNVAVMAHSGAGKTSLVEALLYRSGARSSLGSVAQGSTASDFTPEEKERQISVYTTIHPLSWKGSSFNLLDTPGYADFVGEIRGAQVAADTALIIVSAVSGVEVGSERVWRSAAGRELNRLLVINKMDCENADFFRTIAELEATFNDALNGNVAALQLPIGQADTFRGVVDLLHLKAFEWRAGEPTEIPVPDDMAAVAAEYRARLVEAIVETDDALLTRYLENLEIDEDALLAAFSAAVKANALSPVALTSATSAIGMSLLLDFLDEGVRFVEDHRPLPTVQGDAPVLGAAGAFCARVFKTTIDPYRGKVSYVRVLAGRVEAGDTLLDSTREVHFKAAHLYLPNGKDLEEVKALSAGMIGALTKVDDLKTGDTLCLDDELVELVALRLPSPVMALALFPKSRSDDDKLSGALAKLVDEDATLSVERNAETHETVLWGMGHVHLEIAVNKLRDRYNVDVTTQLPKITYRETLTKGGDARYRHRKQSGGSGQFGEVALRVEPLPRGAGFVFENKVVGGAIPSQFISSCEKGVLGALDRGVLGGFQVVDVKVTVYDGKNHPVDSKDIAFQLAAAHACREALKQAAPALLEPVTLVKVRVPGPFTGDVISDLNTRRGRILGMDSEGAVSVVSAHVPAAELQMYSPDLRSITGGRGAFSLKFDHYAEVPPHVAAKVLAARQREAA